MKKTLLTTTALIGLVLACNAMSITEQDNFIQNNRNSPDLVGQRWDGSCHTMRQYRL